MPWQLPASPTLNSPVRNAPNHAHVVERLFLVVEPDTGAAIPVMRLHLDLVAEFALQLFHRGRRIAAELGRRAVSPDRIELHGLFRRVNPDEPVEKGEPLVIVV